MDLYFKNVSEDGTWADLSNWFLDYAATQPANLTAPPWATTATASANIHRSQASEQAGDQIVINTELGNAFAITGTCDISQINGNGLICDGSIAGGVFTGSGFQNNHLIYGGVFTGAGFSNAGGTIYGGVFTGAGFSNAGGNIESGFWLKSGALDAAGIRIVGSGHAKPHEVFMEIVVPGQDVLGTGLM